MDRKLKYFLIVALLALAAFLAVAFATTRPGDWPFARGASWRGVENLSGPLGSLAAFSFFAWFIPLCMAALAVGIVCDRVRATGRIVFKSAIIVVLLNALFTRVAFTRDSGIWSGLVGRDVAAALTALLGRIGGTIILITCLLLVLLKEVRFVAHHGFEWAKRNPVTLRMVGRFLWVGLGFVAGLLRRAFRAVLEGFRSGARRWSSWRRSRVPRVEVPPPETAAARPVPSPEETVHAETAAGSAEPERVRPSAQRPVPKRPVAIHKPVSSDKTIPIEDAVLPTLAMLKSGGQGGFGFSSEKLKSWSAVLEGKLANYGIEGHVTAVNQGPLVTTFEFEPVPGVKVREIVSRADDLALAMKARSLRLIAPIPGRSVVGIEIPNPDQEVVYFHDVLKEIPDRLRVSGIMIALGVEVTGQPFYLNLCSAPHLLMAGTTGSGKSVSLNCFLASILFQYRPTDVRLLLVDPKQVELSMYNGIPHLLHPVITDPRDAVRVFTYLIAEMERRNEVFRENGVKNIESFNSKVALGKTAPEGKGSKLPYIVLVVDELGDLVLTKGADIESLLSRLSNMARAVGIHMIVATQRPSVDVIVGKTKANFPTRIAFRVASKVDSRTILDCMGAEKLLGKGDMLLSDAKHPESLRLHGAWLSEEELEKLVNHWKQYTFEESRLELYESKQVGGHDQYADAYFEDAREIVLRYRQGSTSLLQRKLHIGYARAARVLDQLEQAGIVGPPDGSKPREVLVNEEAEVGYPSDDEAV